MRRGHGFYWTIEIRHDGIQVFTQFFGNCIILSIVHITRAPSTRVRQSPPVLLKTLVTQGTPRVGPMLLRIFITTSPLGHRQSENMTRPPVPKPPATTTYSPDSPAKRHDRQDGGGLGRRSLKRPNTQRAPPGRVNQGGEAPETQVS